MKMLTYPIRFVKRVYGKVFGRRELACDVLLLRSEGFGFALLGAHRCRFEALVVAGTCGEVHLRPGAQSYG